MPVKPVKGHEITVRGFERVRVWSRGRFTGLRVRRRGDLCEDTRFSAVVPCTQTLRPTCPYERDSSTVRTC